MTRARLDEIEPPGSLHLTARRLILDSLQPIYHGGVAVWVLVLLVVGGFVRVLARWLDNEVSSYADVVQTLGGVCPRVRVKDPDADLGPVLSRSDAPRLVTLVAAVAGKMGVPAPDEIRLSYLPCCAATAWRRRHALVVGLPLLNVLTVGELRAVLAHELAHLARGDATRAAAAVHFIEFLQQAVRQAGPRAGGPLLWWARSCLNWGLRSSQPVALGQEARADRAAARLAGPAAAASALVKVALVQPLFREVLAACEGPGASQTNAYALFRNFWDQLPEGRLAEWRQRLLASEGARRSAEHHPALLDRLALVQQAAESPTRKDDREPATCLLNDLEALETMMHNRLFGLGSVDRSVFHRAGTG